MAGQTRVPPAVHHLVSAVRAPASALSTMDGQLHPGGLAGLYVGDVRVLDSAVVLVNGESPDPLAHWADGPGRLVFVGVLRRLGDAGFDPTVRLERTRELHPDGMTERLRLVNTAAGALDARVTMTVTGDVTPLETVRRGAPPDGRPITVGEAALTWADAAGSNSVTVTAPGARLSADGVCWEATLAPGAELAVEWSVRVATARPVLRGADGPVPWRVPTIDCADPRLARLVARSLDDLAALRLAEPGSDAEFLGAGVPWFLTLFGRDSLWAARMLLPLGTDLAAGTLRTLARRQGTRLDPESGEAPGKIMHELRHEDRRIGTTEFLPATYFGTIDATLLWISLLHDAWRWGLPDATVVELLPHLRAALGWIEGYADPDGDGFLEYLDHTGRGLANQGWKDSGTAIQFHDGRLARPPIALCEVQGYAHRAALDAAALLDALGEPDGHRWRGYAADLNARFRERFWVRNERGRYPALAIDADGRPVDALTSNIGHLLGSGLLDGAETAAVVAHLGGDELAGGYGLRTMGTGDAGYAPLAYHCGAVWPHDTAIVVDGLARVAGQGGAAAGSAARAATRLLDGLLAAAEAFDYRLPELYGGDARTSHGRPVPHPGACSPQAWAAAASIALLRSVLGVEADVPGGLLRVRPLAGAPLGPVSVDGLVVAGTPIGLRTGDGVAITGVPDGLTVDAPGTPLPAPRPPHGAARDVVEPA